MQEEEILKNYNEYYRNIMILRLHFIKNKNDEFFKNFDILKKPFEDIKNNFKSFEDFYYEVFSKLFSLLPISFIVFFEEKRIIDINEIYDKLLEKIEKYGSWVDYYNVEISRASDIINKLVDKIVEYYNNSVKREYFIGNSFVFGINPSHIMHVYLKTNNVVKNIKDTNSKTNKINEYFSELTWLHLITLIGM